MSEPPHRISYKRYLTHPEETIPARTQRRWAQKKRIKVAEELEDVLEEGQKKITETSQEEDTRTAPDDECTSRPVQIEVPVDSGHTKEQTQLLLLALKLKHSLTNDCLEDVMRIINVVGGHDSVCRTKYSFYKAFDYTKDIMRICYVCEQCTNIMSAELDHVHCVQCNITHDKANRLTNFFIYLSLEDQIKKLLEMPGIIDSIVQKQSESSTSFSDITDGLLYQNAIRASDKPLQTLTLTFSCDGVPVFKKSPCSIWPLLCTINELPVKMRQDNVLLCGLWFGDEKPHMTTFLKPFVDECVKLEDSGFTWEKEKGVFINTKVIPLVLVSDSVARPLLQNIKQFNGEYGCSYCLHKGKLVEKGRGSTRVYPFHQNLDLRNQEQTNEFVENALESGQPAFGVKGPSVLCRLPSFDVIEGCVPDYMHSVLLGVARTVTGLWLNSENHEKHWYIGRSRHLIDELLLKIKPPCNVPRVPRSVTLRKFWKAHEWYMWLFYYSLPVLKGILPEPLLNHWSKLVKGVSLLLGENITREQITESESLLTDFVKDMEVYYGETNMSYNVHLCLHLPRSVVNWGPLWAHSAFVFESYNAKLLDMIKSTQGVALQIVKTFWLQKALPFYGQTIMQDASNECKEIFEILTRPKQLKHVTRTCDITALDRPKVRILGRDDYIALSRYRVQRARVKYFQRIVANGEVIHSEDYSCVFKRNSFTVMLNDDDQNFFSIKSFVICQNENEEMCYAIGRFYERAKHSLCASNPRYFEPVSKHLGHLTAITASDIKCKCMIIHTEKLQVDYICININHCEFLK
nr:uncharacterized protein LOC129446026 [Misgurnus anguillicaudatus]